jgi:CRP-like cAMP-binding protein
VVEVMTANTVRAKLTPGLFFGEISLLFGRMKRTASIRALTSCVLYSLSKGKFFLLQYFMYILMHLNLGDMDAVLQHHSKMAARIRVVGEERLEQLKALKKAERESNRLKEAMQQAQTTVQGPKFNLTIKNDMGSSINIDSKTQTVTSASETDDAALKSKKAVLAEEIRRSLVSRPNIEGRKSEEDDANNLNIVPLISVNSARDIDQILDEEEKMEREKSNSSG